MTILLVSDDDRSALACNLLAQQLEQCGHACLTIGPALSSRRDSPLPSVTPQIPLTLMNLMGHALLDSASAVAATLNNIGPGLGTVGPTKNYGHFGELSKLLFVWLMMLGRLEIFPVLVLCIPGFWRNT